MDYEKSIVCANYCARMFCYSVDAHIEKKNHRTDNVSVTRVGEQKDETVWFDSLREEESKTSA